MPTKSPADKKAQGGKKKDAKVTKKSESVKDRNRPQRRNYRTFVAGLPPERQEQQLWGLFSWITRLRGS